MASDIDVLPIRAVENGVVHASTYGFETACGRRLEWGVYDHDDPVDCIDCLVSELAARIREAWNTPPWRCNLASVQQEVMSRIAAKLVVTERRAGGGRD